MLLNYLKVTLRNLLRNRLTSIINIGGLAVGMAIGVLILIWIQQAHTMDAFHKNLRTTCLMMQHVNVNGSWHTNRSMPPPLGPTLSNKVPEIAQIARVTYPMQQLVKAGNNSLYEQGLYAEPGFFKIMSFAALEGNPVAALQEAGSVVITERTARKLFGNEQAVGKTIRHNNARNVKVGAVIRDIPENSSIHFDIVAPFTVFAQENSSWMHSWNSNGIQTWIQTQPSVDLSALNNKLKNFFREHTGDTRILFAYPFKDLYLHGQFSDGHEEGGLMKGVVVIGIIGALILLIACVNFMNLATARSERRAREVGVRKVMGASRKRIIFQFLGEALLLSFLSLVLSILLVKLSMPLVNSLPDMNLSFNFLNWQLWLALIMLTIITGLVAGSYPAFFLSSFRPVRVLKNVVFNRGGSRFRKSLVTFQFVISIFLIISVIVLFLQQQHAQDRPIGYEQENLLAIPVRGDMADRFDIIKAGLRQIPGVISVSAATNNLVRVGSFTDGLQWPGKAPDQNLMVAVSTVQYNWVKTAGITLAAGRDFSPGYGTDSLSCLINEAAVERMGLKEPVIGTVLSGKTVIGVMKDFVYNSPTELPRPMIVYLGKAGMSHLFVRLKNAAHWQKTVEQIEKVVVEINPDHPFEYALVKEEYQKRLRGLEAAVQLTGGLGILAIIISCLGLFGLSAYLVERRTKEIGIRKVLGAGVPEIWFMLCGNFLKPVMIAFLIASPLAALVMQKLLSDIEYHINLSWWMFAAAGLLALFIAVTTVSVEGIKGAMSNPVKSLRNE